MTGPLAAGVWGFVAAAPLLFGALIGIFARTSQRWISLIMAVGAGVLISSVAFELMEEAFKIGGFDAVTIGLASGALVYFAADWAVNHWGTKHRKRSSGKQSGNAAIGITIGALLDGIPESIAIGVSLLAGGAVGWVMVVAVFLSNVPESLSAAAGMKKAGYSRKFILSTWSAVVAVSVLAAILGNLLLKGASGNVIGSIQAFAAGAILTMLASTMMPEAYEEGGSIVGLVTSLGFLAAFIMGHLKK